MKHWTQVWVHPYIKIDPLFWVGAEREVKIREHDEKGHVFWKTELVYFDYDFLVFYFARQLKALLPLSEDRIKTLLEDVLAEYVKALSEEKQKNDKT